jgi:hypothetical protein
MKQKTPFTVGLEAAKLAFLEEMARKHHLEDAGKAIRCLIDHARENPELHEAIFGGFRCIDCGA